MRSNLARREPAHIFALSLVLALVLALPALAADDAAQSARRQVLDAALNQEDPEIVRAVHVLVQKGFIDKIAGMARPATTRRVNLLGMTSKLEKVCVDLVRLKVRPFVMQDLSVSAAWWELGAGSTIVVADVAYLQEGLPGWIPKSGRITVDTANWKVVDFDLPLPNR